jgi:hypothetical protein
MIVYLYQISLLTNDSYLRNMEYFFVVGILSGEGSGSIRFLSQTKDPVPDLFQNVSNPEHWFLQKLVEFLNNKNISQTNAPVPLIFWKAGCRHRVNTVVPDTAMEWAEN